MTENLKGRFFEDYVINETQKVGIVTMNEAEIIDFATQYDPQEFHLDPAKAALGPFGGLIASGWHTAAKIMRLLIDSYLSASSLGSPGIDELRWLVPVRPGDVLTVYSTVTAARQSRSKPDRGLLHTSMEAFNQDGQKVITMKSMSMVFCRDTETTA